MYTHNHSLKIAIGSMLPLFVVMVEERYIPALMYNRKSFHIPKGRRSVLCAQSPEMKEEVHVLRIWKADQKLH